MRIKTTTDGKAINLKVKMKNQKNKSKNEVFTYIKYLEEKEKELKKLLENLNFHILMEIILFLEIQKQGIVGISILIAKNSEIKNNEKSVLTFSRKIGKDIKQELVSQQYDIKSRKVTTIVKKDYIKTLFGYFKNDKFRKHFQIIRCLIFGVYCEIDFPIDISSIIPLKKRLFDIAFFNGSMFPLNVTFKPKSNKKIFIKSIFFMRCILSNSFNKMLENIHCEKFVYQKYDKKKQIYISLTTGLKNLKQINFNHTISLLFLSNEKQFNFSESFLNLKKVKFLEIEITKIHFNYMLEYFKRLKTVILGYRCSFDLFELLNFLKNSKIKKLYLTSPNYHDEDNKYKEIFEPKNIDKFKNSTLEKLGANFEDENYSFSWIKILPLIFKNIKSLRFIKSGNIPTEYSLYFAKLNIEKIKLSIPCKEFLVDFFENTDKKKLKKLSIEFYSTGMTMEEFTEIKNFPRLTSFKFVFLGTNYKLDSNDKIITPKFLDFIENCNIREFSLFLYKPQIVQTKICTCNELLFKRYLKNQNMKFLKVSINLFKELICRLWKKR